MKNQITLNQLTLKEVKASTLTDSFDHEHEILEFCITSRSRKDIMNLFGLQNNTDNYNRYIVSLLNKDLLMTVPDKSESKGQKYVITAAGIKVCEFTKEYVHEYRMKCDKTYKSEYLKNELIQKFDEWGMKKVIDEVGQFSGVGRDLYYKCIGENRFLIFSYYANNFDPWIVSYKNENEIGKKSYIYIEEDFACPNFNLERDFHFIKEFV